MKISTHTPLARRDLVWHLASSLPVISTHTPLARRDCGCTSITLYISQFLLTRLLRGATGGAPGILHRLNSFLLTRLLRGATEKAFKTFNAVSDFYSHASCEARRLFWLCLAVADDFYSHASCEARRSITRHIIRALQFLLTRLLRGATATYSIRNSRTSYIQEADFNILHDPAIKSRRTCLSFMHHNTFACYSP